MNHANEYRITMYARDYETATDIAHALPFAVTRGYLIEKLDENGQPYEFNITEDDDPSAPVHSSVEGGDK